MDERGTFVVGRPVERASFRRGGAAEFSAPRRVCVTGAAGFIGSHLSHRLAKEGNRVIGLDNLNDYYDVNLKHARLATLEVEPMFSFTEADLTNAEQINEIVDKNRPDIIVNLAAQVGVRNSLQNPGAYIADNLVGFGNVLDAAHRLGVGQVIYASSSSVYGANSKVPFSTGDPADHPINLYAATKRANELLAHSYSHLYGLPTTGLRFFTVYGPWGRPDMAYYKFADAITNGKPIDVYGDGEQLRDFTFVDDVVQAIADLCDQPATGNDGWPDTNASGTSSAPWQVLNIGRGEQATVNHIISLLEKHLNREAIRHQLPPQNGDMLNTHADVSDLVEAIGFQPTVGIEDGLAQFAAWYREYSATETIIDLRTERQNREVQDGARSASGNSPA